VLMVALVMLAAPAVGESTGPVAAYSFDEGSGTAVGDASGNAHTVATLCGGNGSQAGSTRSGSTTEP